MSRPDVLIVGAGIVGAACARELVAEGLSVAVVDAGRPGGGATAACMGHVVVMDDSEAQFALCRSSQQLWDELAEELPAAVERDPCGTLWLAADDDELATVRAKEAFYRQRGVEVEVLDRRALGDAEPCLGPDLLGALRVPGDSVVYPPPVVDWLLAEADGLGDLRLLPGVRVAAVGDGGARLADGGWIEAGQVVVAAGVAALTLLPEPVAGVTLEPRKGQLVITDRVPGFCRHQLVELGYLQSAHGQAEAGAASVAFNLQPRATGQMLLGSSRQFGARDAVADPAVTARMVERGALFVPGLRQLRAIRVWCGFRPATGDHLPLIGPVPGRSGLCLAAGHEGLGITTALATARLVAHHLTGQQPLIDPTPYLPGRGLAAAANHG